MISKRWDRAFFIGMASLIIVTVFVGFAPSFYLKSHFQRPPLPLLLHVHGVVFTCWLILFLTQVVFIAARRADLHRKAGLLGVALLCTMLVLGPYVAFRAARRDYLGGDPEALEFLATPLGDVFAFAVLSFAGVILRNRPATHKRLMFLATVSMLPAAFGRWPFEIMSSGPQGYFGFTDIFIVFGIVYDLVSRRRVDQAYMFGGVFLVVTQVGRVALSHTSAWNAFAKMLVH